MFDDTPHWRGRPTAVWTVVLLDLAGAMLCLYGVFAPATAASPTASNAAAAGLALGLAVALWWCTPGPGAWLVHANLVLFVLGTSTLVMLAATGEGALSAAFSHLLVLLHAAMFFPVAVRRSYLALVLTTFTAALVANDVIVAPVAAWLPVAIACVVGSELLGWLRAQTRRLAATDPLTGLQNRVGFEHDAAREMAIASRTGEPLTVAIMDLDGFKSVNDAHGHAAGDAMLRRHADHLSERLRARDLLARLGGDEFVVLLPDTTEAATEMLLAELRIGSPTAWTHGVSCVTQQTGLTGALASADARMYARKRMHPNAPPRHAADQFVSG